MSKVFIIDDDPIHQRIAQIMIEKHNIYDEFKSYTEAGKALEYLQQNIAAADALPDVILLDLNMPVVDGWDFLEKFDTFRNALSKSIKIYIVSSSVDEKDIMRSQSYAYVHGFISKPLSPDIIRNTR
ncbi:response regulator [Desertivirga xinjiangensis]|uniref:response regulator n=1 Tax=Desertivirga xinjiangensis TaxID=539206 RepID=UPI00210B35CF|nr:response regulator [Pedobacter xinjiangensis]